jgi:hypothetical protein
MPCCAGNPLSYAAGFLATSMRAHDSPAVRNRNGICVGTSSTPRGQTARSGGSKAPHAAPDAAQAGTELRREDKPDAQRGSRTAALYHRCVVSGYTVDSRRLRFGPSILARYDDLFRRAEHLPARVAMPENHAVFVADFVNALRPASLARRRGGLRIVRIGHGTHRVQLANPIVCRGVPYRDHSMTVKSKYTGLNCPRGKELVAIIENRMPKTLSCSCVPRAAIDGPRRRPTRPQRNTKGFELALADQRANRLSRPSLCRDF